MHDTNTKNWSASGLLNPEKYPLGVYVRGAVNLKCKTIKLPDNSNSAGDFSKEDNAQGGENKTENK